MGTIHKHVDIAGDRIHASCSGGQGGGHRAQSQLDLLNDFAAAGGVAVAARFLRAALRTISNSTAATISNAYVVSTQTVREQDEPRILCSVIDLIE